MTISLKNIHKSFGQKKIIQDLSLEIHPGLIHYILGKSGTGKSVTLRLIVGLLAPDAGEISVENLLVDIENEKIILEVRKKCSMIFQHPALIDALSIEENILFSVRKNDPKVNHELMQKYLDALGIPKNTLKLSPQEISYGTQKRVAIARALMTNPKYLLFDEPTTGLDPVSTTKVTDLIADLSKKLQCGCIVVSHDMLSAFRTADEIIFLDEGRLRLSGGPEVFLKTSDSLIQSFVREVELKNE